MIAHPHGLGLIKFLNILFGGLASAPFFLYNN
jgi:hypothetical protein